MIGVLEVGDSDTGPEARDIDMVGELKAPGDETTDGDVGQMVTSTFELDLVKDTVASDEDVGVKLPGEPLGEDAEDAEVGTEVGGAGVGRETPGLVGDLAGETEVATVALPPETEGVAVALPHGIGRVKNEAPTSDMMEQASVSTADASGTTVAWFRRLLTAEAGTIFVSAPMIAAVIELITAEFSRPASVPSALESPVRPLPALVTDASCDIKGSISEGKLSWIVGSVTDGSVGRAKLRTGTSVVIGGPPDRMVPVRDWTSVVSMPTRDETS